MNRLFNILLISGVMVSVVLANDFSKMSDRELINIAGKIQASEVPDYRIAVHSKMSNMKIKEAREFRDKIRQNKRLAMDNMTMKEYRAYRLQVREAIDRKIDELGGVVKAREAGLFGYGGCEYDCSLDFNCKHRQRFDK